MQPEEVHEGG